MKNLYSLFFLFTIMVSGCSQDEVVKEQPSSSEPLIFTASFGDDNSRTYLNEDEHLCWTANDLISVFAANTYNQKYQFQGKTGANSGDFEAVTSNSYQTGNDLSRHYAIYPYNSSSTITENGVITATLPAEQSYAAKSFGLEANTMVAATADKNDKFLKFKNVGGYLELNLYGNDVTVKSITLQGNSNEKLAGSATITPIYNGNPTVVMANNATNTITLDCGEGVTIGSTTETATTFWIVVPPTTFEEGFTITVTDINGSTFTKSTSKSIEIERNVIQSMSAFEMNTMNWFNPNQYITYVKNHEWVYVGSKNYYQYSSHIECPVKNISKMEFKYKLTDLHSPYYYYLCCKNVEADKTSSIYIKKDVGLVIENEHWDEDDGWILISEVSYLWDELNVEVTDCMTLEISFKDKYIQMNNVELEYKISQYTNFNTDYLFTYYTHKNDEGIWCVLGEGVPEGSKLYYIKIWDENDNLVYLGAASKALNPITNKEEYCWKSHYNGEYKYEFAYYPTTNSNYTPYEGGID